MCPVYFPMLFAFPCCALSVIGHLAVDSALEKNILYIC